MNNVDASSSSAKAQIGVTGLAVMGSNIARNFARHGYTVALHNRSIAKTDALIENHGGDGDFIRTETMAEFVAALADLVEQRLGTPTAPPRVSACAQGTWFDTCAPDCCVKVLRGQSEPRPTIAQRPVGEPIPVGLDENGEVIHR